MDWLSIFEVIMALLADCREQRSRDVVADGVRKRGRFERLALRIALRRRGLSTADIAEAMEMVDTVQDDDVDAIVDAAEEVVTESGKALAE